MAAATNLQVLLESHGSPSKVLRLAEAPRPTPGPVSGEPTRKGEGTCGLSTAAGGHLPPAAAWVPFAHRQFWVPVL